MAVKQDEELHCKSIPTKVRAALFAGLGICLLSGCSNAQHQAKVEELNTDYCTEEVQNNCRYIAAGFLTPVQPNDAFEEQLKPIHERQEVIEQEFEVSRRK
jgi:hypothetical protein